MTEQEIARILTSTFNEQIEIYKQIEEINNKHNEGLASGKNSQEALNVIRQKKEKMDRLSALNGEMSEAKDQWLGKKDKWESPELKSQVEMSITMLSEQINLTIDSEKKLAPKPSEPTADLKNKIAGKYKSPGN